MAYNSQQVITGTVAADGSAGTTDVDGTVIAAQGANTVVRLLKATVTVRTAATGGGGEVALEDGAGGTRFFVADADAVGVYNLDFEPAGYPLTANTLLNLTVDGGATTEANARCTAIAYVAK